MGLCQSNNSPSEELPICWIHESGNVGFYLHETGSSWLLKCRDERWVDFPCYPRTNPRRIIRQKDADKEWSRWQYNPSPKDDMNSTSDDESM